MMALAALAMLCFVGCMAHSNTSEARLAAVLMQSERFARSTVEVLYGEPVRRELGTSG